MRKTIIAQYVPQESFHNGQAKSTPDLLEVTAEHLATKWKAPPEGIKQLAKEEGMDITVYQSDRLKQQLVWWFIRDWAGGSGGSIAQYIIYSEAKRLGFFTVDFNGKVASMVKWLKDKPEAKTALENLGTLIYTETQKLFKQLNIHTLTVHRNGKAAEDRLFSSWSTEQFGTRNEGRSGKPIVKIEVPVKYVFSTPKTGFGTLYESEVVLFGGHRK
jgi:hypothetical protein